MKKETSLMDTISDTVKRTLKSDLVKAGACGALFLTSPALPVLTGVAAVAGAVGLGYFSGKHIQKKTLLKTLEKASNHRELPSIQRDR